MTEKKRSVSSGCWDSIHIVEARDCGNGEGKYKLTTTVMLSMLVPDTAAGEVNLSGSLTRQASKTCKYLQNPLFVTRSACFFLFFYIVFGRLILCSFFFVPSLFLNIKHIKNSNLLKNTDNLRFLIFFFFF